MKKISLLKTAAVLNFYSASKSIVVLMMFLTSIYCILTVFGAISGHSAWLPTSIYCILTIHSAMSFMTSSDMVSSI